MHAQVNVYMLVRGVSVGSAFVCKRRIGLWLFRGGLSSWVAVNGVDGGRSKPNNRLSSDRSEIRP